jgi:hypothetical protein
MAEEIEVTVTGAFVHQNKSFIVKCRCWGCFLPVDVLDGMPAAQVVTTAHSFSGQRCPGSERSPFYSSPTEVTSALTVIPLPSPPPKRHPEVFWMCDQCGRNSSSHRRVLCWPLGVLRRLRRG